MANDVSYNHITNDPYQHCKKIAGYKKMMILEKGKALQLLSNMQYYLSKQTIMCALLFNDFGL